MNWAQLLRKTSPCITMVGYDSANNVMRERLLENSNSVLKIIEANTVKTPITRAGEVLAEDCKTAEGNDD